MRLICDLLQKFEMHKNWHWHFPFWCHNLLFGIWLIKVIHFVCLCVNNFAGTEMCAAAVSNAQQKFSSLRRRLDQLGYRQPLGIESLPLVERLFADLIHTTESLKNSRLNTSTTAASSRRADGDGTYVASDAQIDAYKSDNARLIRENNELHQQLIHAKEDSEFIIKGWNRTDFI